MRAGAFMEIAVQRMVCTGCGAEANASCDCGKAYLPAKVRAAEAVKANPQKSNRAIADEIGVSDMTVKRARDEAGATHVAPEREGRDGKIYPMPVRDKLADAKTKAHEAVEHFFTVAELALRVKNLDLSAINPTDDMRRLAKEVVETWSNLKWRPSNG